VVNDLIETSGHYGRVAEITMRSTRVVTVDGRMLAIPNAQIVNAAVASYTNFPHLRLDIAFSVGVGEDLTRVRKMLLETLEGDPRYQTEPAASVVVTELNDYNVGLALRVWLKDERCHLEERFALRERVFEKLRAAGVDMPFETLQIEPLRVHSAA
jgi:small conductance mechanosensitive channel